MILPEKHISIDESLFGFGAYLLNYIDSKISIDRLWKMYSADYKNNVYDVCFSFDQYIITIDYLYSIGAIEMNEKGEIYYAVNQIDS